MKMVSRRTWVILGDTVREPQRWNITIGAAADLNSVPKHQECVRLSRLKRVIPARSKAGVERCRIWPKAPPSRPGNGGQAVAESKPAHRAESARARREESGASLGRQPAARWGRGAGSRSPVPSGHGPGGLERRRGLGLGHEVFLLAQLKTNPGQAQLCWASGTYVGPWLAARIGAPSGFGQIFASRQPPRPQSVAGAEPPFGRTAAPGCPGFGQGAAATPS